MSAMVATTLPLRCSVSVEPFTIAVSIGAREQIVVCVLVRTARSSFVHHDVELQNLGLLQLAMEELLDQGL